MSSTPCIEDILNFGERLLDFTMAKETDVRVYKESWLRSGVDIELHHRCHEKWYCAVDTGPAPHQQRGIETGSIFPANAVAFSCLPCCSISQIVIGLGEVSGGLACARRGVGWLPCAGSASTAAAEVAPLSWKRLPQALDWIHRGTTASIDFTNTALWESEQLLPMH